MAEYNPYTKTEEEVVRAFYPTEGAKGCVARLRELGYVRNSDSVRIKAASLGVRRDRSKKFPVDSWSEEEISVLRRHYPQLGVKGTRKALSDAGFDRSYVAVRDKAAELGVNGPHYRKKAKGKGDVKLIHVCLDTNFDADIIDEIESQRNRSEYIRSLVRLDMS